jgi:23S rRNA A1618 N6-methylase RlmF
MRRLVQFAQQRLHDFTFSPFTINNQPRDDHNDQGISCPFIGSNTASIMDVDEGSHRSRKRAHPDSAAVTVTRSSAEVLALVENPNFEELSRHYPSFQKAWNDTRQKQKESKARKSFSSCVSQDFTVSLTRGLLQAYFKLQLPHLESKHLCPPVPNRFFYLHWIDTHLLNGNRAQRLNCGMDIGTGATCIYPLLAAKFFKYNMAASEIDNDALALARLNVTANQLNHKIRLLEVPPSHSQQPSLPPGGPVERALRACGGGQTHRFDFIMTNPPFYDPESMEHCTPRAGDGRDRTSMTVSEGSYPNGEIGFVTEMIADSLQARQSSLWFSSMLGKKTSLVKLEKLLIHLLGPAHVETTEYGPGQYTRWFVAWNFRKPSAFTPAAHVRNPKDTFGVVLDGIPNAQQAMNEVASRICVFCQSSPGGWNLTVQQLPMHNSHVPRLMLQIQESDVPPIANFVDESEGNINIPQIVLHALQGQTNSDFLPSEGHFVIQVALEPTMNNEAEGGIGVNVQLACYRHSSRGLKAIEKVRSGIEGEVARTNRKWRRIRQRQ